MKSRTIFTCIVLLIAGPTANRLVAQSPDSLIYWSVPDTAKVISVMQLFQLPQSHPVFGRAGIGNNLLTLQYGYGRKGQYASLTPSLDNLSNTGHTAMKPLHKLYQRQKIRTTVQDTIGLFLTCARDSASRKQIFSGYLYFPQLKKWKLVGVWEKEGVGEYYKGILTAVSARQTITGFIPAGSWYQMNTGVWKEQSTTGIPVPQQMPFSNIDSLEQAKREHRIIKKLPEASSLQEKEGVYYQILEPGSGNLVNLTDTVTVFYKGYLLKDGTIFDQMDKEPRKFPLNRLIKGWQIGVPLLKTGGKIKLIIPSGTGYGIRTRGAKIPPNSILVFEIEVVKTMPNAR